MKILTLTCDHCGAPLEIPAKTRYVTCTYCSSRLQVHQDGGAAYTEVLEAIGERADAMARNLETIKLQNELERIDREWVQQRENFMVQGQNGRKSLPSKSGAAWSVVFIIFGLFFTLTAGVIFPPFAFFGLIIMVIVIVAAVSGYKKAEAYEAARKLHETRRREVLDQLRASEV